MSRLGCSHRGNLIRLGIAAAAAFSIASAVSPAALASHVQCPAVITHDTTLDSDLSCDGDGLIIRADDVVVDLNGHQLTGRFREFGSFPRFAAINNSSGYDRVTVKNGVIRGFDYGVLLGGSIEQNERTSATGNVLDRLDIGSLTGIGVFSSRENRVERSSIAGYVWSMWFSGDSTGNTVADSVTGYISIPSGATIALFDGSDRNVFERNELHGGIRSDSVGIVAVDNTLVSMYEGITFLGGIGNVVARNRAVDRSYIFVAGMENVVEDNQLLGSLGGMQVRGRDNYVAGNRLVGTSGGIVISGDSVVERNRVIGTPGDGISVTDGAPILSRNRAIGNGDDGIDIEAPGTVLERNSANRNGDLGIEAVAGTTDGGGNKASANGDPAQCVNVFCK